MRGLLEDFIASGYAIWCAFAYGLAIFSVLTIFGWLRRHVRSQLGIVPLPGKLELLDCLRTHWIPPFVSVRSPATLLCRAEITLVNRGTRATWARLGPASVESNWIAPEDCMPVPLGVWRTFDDGREVRDCKIAVNAGQSVRNVRVEATLPFRVPEDADGFEFLGSLRHLSIVVETLEPRASRIARIDYDVRGVYRQVQAWLRAEIEKAPQGGGASDELVRALERFRVAADLTGPDLWFADLARAHLPMARLRKADLTGANLREAVLTEADLTWAILAGADMSGATLVRANLREADLTGANLTGSCLHQASLARANLTSARLVDADLTEAFMIGATLSRADLTGADVADEVLFFAASLQGATLPDGSIFWGEIGEFRIHVGL